MVPKYLRGITLLVDKYPMMKKYQNNKIPPTGQFMCYINGILILASSPRILITIDWCENFHFFFGHSPTYLCKFSL
jgi:hypothetical protein